MAKISIKKQKLGKTYCALIMPPGKQKLTIDTLKWVKRLIRPHKWNARSNSKIDDNMKDGKKSKICEENQQNPE
jgi:hypothetical protein